MSFPHERPEQIDTCIRCLRDTLRLPAATNTTTYAVCAECAAKQWAEERELALAALEVLDEQALTVPLLEQFRRRFH